MASEICPSTVFWMMSAFSSPHAVRYILRAEMMVATPMVMEQGGTASCVPKLMVISSREVASMRMRRDVVVMPEPGSLVAILPMRADTEQHHVDASERLDALLVESAVLRYGILTDASVGRKDILLFDVDMVEEAFRATG
jgi:hypothetical protein